MLASPFLPRHFDFLQRLNGSCSVRAAHMACVCGSDLAESFFFFFSNSILGLGSKNLANIFFLVTYKHDFPFPYLLATYIRRAHAYISLQIVGRPVQPHATCRIASETFCHGARLPAAITWQGRCRRRADLLTNHGDLLFLWPYTRSGAELTARVGD